MIQTRSARRAGPTYASVTSTIDGLVQLPVTLDADGRANFPFHADAGLYQLSIIVDASRHNWDELYINLDRFNNTGQRTGPWDFDLNNNNSPLVPSYRVRLDGRDIGMWFFQRVSLEDMAQKRFRGNMAIWLKQGGEHTLGLLPYRAMDIDWLSARLEVDPEDRLEPPPAHLKPAEGNCPVSSWSEESFWAEQRWRLSSSHAIFGPALRDAFDQVMAFESPHFNLIPLLVAAHHLERRDGALQRALTAIDEIVERQYWGNPNPDGYSHNGDMHAAYAMQQLAWSIHMLRDQLGDARRQRIIDKLILQGDIFIELGLLNRDYWGGSVMQDHGRKSWMAFSIAALCLHGIIPQARRWLTYSLPRLRRSLDAAPRDGVIPASSYFAPRLYLDDTTWFRQTLLTLSGEDIFAMPHVPKIVDYVYTVLHERDGVMLLPSNLSDRVPLDSGGAFFAEIARLHRDGRAQWLVLRTLQGPADPKMRGGAKAWSDALWSFLAYDPTVAAVAPPSPRRHLIHFVDSGIVHYRDDAGVITLSLQCAPLLGHHAYRMAKGSCDRAATAPGDGHFLLCVDGVPLLMTPDNGYRLHSFMRSCMLIDDQGQFGDVGYPMGIPSFRYRGQEIQQVQFDEQTGRGIVRLNLAPSYPEEMDVMHYTRDFTVSPGEILIRDSVTLGQPRRLSWLFQGQRGQITLSDSVRGRFGQEPAVTIEPIGHEAFLNARICPTDVVWSYNSHSGYKPFDHLRYDTTEAVADICMTFRLRPVSTPI